MPPESAAVHRLTVLADHYQFYVQDVHAHVHWGRSHWADPSLAPGGWTKEAVHVHRIGVEPYSIAVGTARNDVVATTLCFHPAEPQTRVEDAEHVVEADLDLPSGDMVIYGPADDPGRDQHISIARGRYRVRVSYVPTRPPTSGSSDTGYGDYFIYLVDLWPTSKPGALAVLKQGPSPWAG